MPDASFTHNFAEFFAANVLPRPINAATERALKRFRFGPTPVKDQPDYRWVCLPKGWQKRADSRRAGWATIADPNGYDRFEFCYTLQPNGDRLAYTQALTRFAVRNNSQERGGLVDPFGYYVFDRVEGVTVHDNHNEHCRGLTAEECKQWLDDPANGYANWGDPQAGWPEVFVPKWWQVWR